MKKRTLDCRLVSNFFQAWIILAQRLRHFQPFVTEKMQQIERVDHTFSLIMIIHDGECGFRARSDAFDALGPWFQFLFGVQIVIALVARSGRIVGEPRIIAPAVQTEVSNA